MAFFIKYEFWYNYLHILKHRNVPVYSVSSIFRPDQVFFKWYGHQYSRVLNCFTRFYVQNEVSRELLSTLGIDNVTVVGDTRFDRVLQIKERPTLGPSLFMEGSEHTCKVFVAGSSWQSDEEIFIPFFKNYRDWALIIAPHVIGEEHLQQIEAQLDAIGFSHTRYTEFTAKEQITPLHKQGGVGGGSALIIDCFGLLSSIYRYATVCYVGGGFGVSIHNTLEAAVWGKPVIFGPENKKFQEAQGLKACGGGLEITCAEDFNRIMERFISDPQTIAEAGQQAGAFVQQMTGATQKILADVQL
jgi:3-deoxy-D-manno-octulosonic-acid transferase